MTEETVETPKKRRGWPKGKKRGPRYPVQEERITMDPTPPVEPPIHVRVTRKGMEPFEFGCAQHFVENGFHVFTYPSKRDPYRQTRREIAISEIVDIEITQAAPVYRVEPSPEPIIHPTLIPAPSKGPVIHAARRPSRSIVEQLETSDGPIKMDEIPGLTFGGSSG